MEMESYWETNSTLNTWAVGYVGDMYRAVITGTHIPQQMIWQFGGSNEWINCNTVNEVFEVRCYPTRAKLESIFNLKRELTLEDDEAVISVMARYEDETKKLNVTIAVKGSFYYLF